MSESVNFSKLEALKPVLNIINEAGEALSDKKRTIATSSIPEVLGGALGAGFGGAASFAALYFAGTVGLSAAGITSGLATAGAIIGGGMAAGTFVLAAPIAILGLGGALFISRRNKRKLNEIKELMLQEAIKKHDAIIRVLKHESNNNKERIEYLTSINFLLQSAIRDIKADLAA